MTNFVCTSPCSRFTSTVAMKTMRFIHCANEFMFEDNFFCISGVLINDLAPMKNCPGRCKVGQISSRGIASTRNLCYGSKV